MGLDCEIRIILIFQIKRNDKFWNISNVALKLDIESVINNLLKPSIFAKNLLLNSFVHRICLSMHFSPKLEYPCKLLVDYQQMLEKLQLSITCSIYETKINLIFEQTFQWKVSCWHKIKRKNAISSNISAYFSDYM